jgi:branched-chain amino acid transport system ATP-binding protein
MPILEGKEVTKYFGGLAAVSNVDFHVNQGEILGLIGPNGAGKSTLFNLISAALIPNTGTILFKGVNITGIKPHKICRMGLARTFQNVKIFSNLSVLDNVLLGSFFGTKARISAVDAQKNAADILEFVGLSSFIAGLASDLTLANQKRLEVARGLATQPEILMLDEMMEGLNSTEISGAMNLVGSIREKGITVIMIEHVMKAIMNVCDRIMVLHHGAKIADGTPQEIVNSKQVMKVYLGEKAHAAS